MAIKKLNVEKYKKESALLGIIVCPEEFSAEIEGTETMDELLAEIAEKIPTGDYDEKRRFNRRDVGAAFSSAYSRILDDNKATNEELGVGVFILTNRTSTNTGWGVNEGIYCIRRDGNKLRGKLLRYNSTKVKSIDDYKGSLVDIVEDGILKGESGSEESKKEFTYDLKSL